MSANSNRQENTKQVGNLLADTSFLEDIRKQMIRFATLQLGDGHLAEDAVQDALIGALKNATSFGGRAALRTWVFAILKNKIADTLRHKQRVVNASSLLREEDEDEDFSELFDRKGFWQPDERPVAWGNPEGSLREAHFWRVFEACLDGLPPKQARVFMMREFIELDAEEICVAVDLTTSNLHVLLHRARLRLRECLENKWYLQGEQNDELS
ncbi:RNA polymerase factor sigma-70 [Gallionella capsiferriformans]|uniref:RNA polymerase, sigma-24 subunit, ECF subfamily n=1 Tax=Gallionella capsiferriformans (strain ES-2) TaxID=395494 RepID=D9SHD5_GALCS|nr:RNA polymerase factor sigma-70 [Gallionella capsiferriformans]ADL55932.1 RNA polymerase, sigma-24 subunit, ECF subfamily [Gallionella capsiferriformans ES-2]